MAARDIEYVELYAHSKQSMIDYFALSFGFTLVAESAGYGKNSALLRQGKVQLVVTEGPATHEFLDAHGDGVADIALTCDDVAATCDAAVAAGGAMAGSAAGNPVVRGYGGTCHTLTPGAGDPGRRLPAGHNWMSTDWMSTLRAPARPGGRIQMLDHVAVCLEAGTLTQYADFYRDVFGLARYSSEYINIGDQGMDSIVVRSASGGVTFTLLEPDSAKRAGQLDAFLGRNGGPGTQHLAFGVDDIFAAVREFGDSGVEFLSTPGSYYDMLVERLVGLRAEIGDLRAANVLADRDEWGYLLQLFTRSPYERNSLFYELIQRRGARGFGSSNIRALYEAVERDRLTAE
jgi:4-hydroxymandelate synthase